MRRHHTRLVLRGHSLPQASEPLSLPRSFKPCCHSESGMKRMKYDGPNKDNSTSHRAANDSVYQGSNKKDSGLLPERSWQNSRGPAQDQNKLNSWKDSRNPFGNRREELKPTTPKANALLANWNQAGTSVANKSKQGNASLNRTREQSECLDNLAKRNDALLSSWNQAGTSVSGEPTPGAINMRLLATIQKYEKASKKSSKKMEVPNTNAPAQNQRGLMATSQKSQPQVQRNSNPGLLRRNALANPTTNYWESNHPLSQLVIIQREYSKQNLNAIGILQGSADFCSIPVTYNWNPIGKVCTVVVNGVRVATVEGVPRKEAKNAVAAKALNELIKHCYTIRILRTHDTEEHVSLQEVSGEASKQKKTGMDKPVEENSMGSKLLKLMGWTGGGLGKEGTGITEPIRPVQIFGRDGLGTNNTVTPAFKDKIHSIVRDFANGSGLGDLAFSSEFTKEQRVEIHKISHLYKLKSASHGKNQYRYLVLSRKFSAKHLLRTLLEKGPTDKYEVIPPTRK